VIRATTAYLSEHSKVSNIVNYWPIILHVFQILLPYHHPEQLLNHYVLLLTNDAL